MSFVHVPYNTIAELVEKFKTLDLNKDIVLKDKNPNFVLIDSRQYYGSYGGLIYDCILNPYSKQSYASTFHSSSIGHGLSVVWWTSPSPCFVGDVYALSAHGRVGVTPSIYEKLRINTI
ncbi:uncharacterized protein CEXT_656511 [Caerostris extrusa]|uniref:Uncharacterized protein n=1 Tax=Caerostris extrusa TaxID=172846 RepID=A0AAV4X1W2_CAEEX|nr:uncharacterized protein CEXT_656511 [Caerostris extrusa]